MRRCLAAIVFAVLVISLPVMCEELKPYGFVNDFAGVLSPEAAKNLEAKLGAYEKETSIEVAVVTVKSLDGLEIEQYAERLWKQWGLGKRGKNNGVMFLVAPNERRMRIATGYGVEGDLPDILCGRIVNDTVKPFFRDGKMEAGIIAGAEGIMSTIGHLTPEAKAAKRVAEEKARAEEQARKENNTQIFLFVFGAIVLGGGAITLIAVAFVRRNRRLKAEKEKLERAKAGTLRFLREFPESLKRLEKELEIFPSRTKAHGDLWVARGLYNALNESVQKSESTQVYDWIDNCDRAQHASNILSSVQEAIELEKTRRQAEKDSKKFFPEVNVLLPETEKRVADKTIFSNTARNLVEKAKNELGKAKKLAEGDNPDWITIVGFLATAIGALRTAPSRTLAKEQEEARIAVEEEERRRKRRQEEAEESARRSAYYASSSSSSSSGSSSSFGGFGGGSTGGGGASGSW